MYKILHIPSGKFLKTWTICSHVKDPLAFSLDYSIGIDFSFSYKNNWPEIAEITFDNLITAERVLQDSYAYFINNKISHIIGNDYIPSLLEFEIIEV